MSVAIRVEVTAAQIEAAGDAPMAWAEPVEAALAALTDQKVSIDVGDGDGTCIATIGQDEWTLLVDLPADVGRWLDARWNGTEPGEPFAFDLPVPEWVVELVARATTAAR